MITLLLVPLVLPFALPPLARRIVHQVRPKVALWTVTSAAVALAVGVVACLGALLLPLALTVPALGRLADLIQPLDSGPQSLVLVTSALATGALAATCFTAGRRALREVRRFRAAHVDVADLPHVGELCVIDDARAEAYALAGTRRRSNRIVVTTGMLRALGPGDLEALLAHERAHLAGRHHVFLAVAQCAGWCHPALARVVAHVSFAVERVADEAAAGACGDRRTTAQAVGRAALASTRSRKQILPPFTAGATGGLVPARVKALLTESPRRSLAPALLAMALLCGTAGASSLAGAVSLHRDVEVAQGENPSD
ncbi:M56 family metallopeptidase [Streptomyces sp. NPDC101151]|uniref:M56 family metallopeptidase n=1 Tax=Streptomyces sp. NPDC101151 TaxID=3366115 RepID=UPI00382700A0